MVQYFGSKAKKMLEYIYKRKRRTFAAKSLLLIAVIGILDFSHFVIALDDNNFKRNESVFQYHDINDCSINEFYDFDSFDCLPCNSSRSGVGINQLLQPTHDKLACECANSNAATMLIINSLDDREGQPYCEDFCTLKKNASCLPGNVMNTFGGGGCNFKYINATDSVPPTTGEATNADGDGGGQAVRITHFEPHGGNDCTSCDLRYNFRYQDYCIASVLMKPYLRYNAFWQATSTAMTHFAELKFVAFFCVTLRNATACQQLANLCVLSHYAFDRNSPCSAFLLAQASTEPSISYASSDADDDQLRGLRPFLFYRRGKGTAQLLTAPLNASRYRLDNQHETRLSLVSSTHSLNGRLLRWGALKLSRHLNLCSEPSAFDDAGGVPFANRERRKVVVLSDCQLSLEQLIDMAQAQANNNFISIYLNYSSAAPTATLLQAIPVLIEDLAVANTHSGMLQEWQLVKRFQMITAHPHSQPHGHQNQQQLQRKSPQLYTDAAKLQLYPQLRYVALAELHYRIHVGEERISLPWLRLRYRYVHLRSNSSLTDLLPFQLRVSYELANGDSDDGQSALITAIALPLLLAGAVAAAAVHAYGCYSRRHPAATTASQPQQQQQYPATAKELCQVVCLGEFLLYCVSYVADAMLITYLIILLSSALRYYATNSLRVSLPLSQTQNDSALGILMYVALVLKCCFLGAHGWRISHCDIFFVDWERPRNYDTTQFNLKSSNLETSSMCSSVRTFTTECSVSAWRVFYTANEWIRLSCRSRTSKAVQCVAVLLIFQLFDFPRLTHNDTILSVSFITLCYGGTHLFLLLVGEWLLPAVYGHPLKRFLDLCTLSNVSVFTLIESMAFGFYIHGRSPHGFADTDMSSMLVQLQRETQNMCGRRGLLNDSDHQMYVIVPPSNLRTYFDRLLVPFQRSISISQAHYHKSETSSSGSSAEHAVLERITVAYSSVNRFFCAFIDHVIRDIDYIIKEKSFLDKLFYYEFDNYLTENRGTFYIDQNYSFTHLFLYGNQAHIFTFELMIIICLYTTGMSLEVVLLLVYVCNKFIQKVFRSWVRQNVAMKTLIDKRFLML